MRNGVGEATWGTWPTYSRGGGGGGETEEERWKIKEWEGKKEKENLEKEEEVEGEDEEEEAWREKSQVDTAGTEQGEVGAGTTGG